MTASVVEATDVWLCGYSARTPVGLCAASAAAAVRAGLSALELRDELVDTFGESARVAIDPNLPLGETASERCGHLFRDVLERLIPETCAQVPRQRILVVIAGNSAKIPVREGDVYAALATHFPGMSANIRVTDDGHASGVVCMGIVSRALVQNHADVAIVVGADSYCDRHTIQTLDEVGDLKSYANRNGFPPGEGAAALLVTSRRVAGALGAPLIALLTAVSASLEHVDPDGDDPIIGYGLSEAINGLAPFVNDADGLITDTYCDLNGVRYRNDELLFTILRTQHLFEDAHNYSHPADCWGDVRAASGPLLVVLAAEAHNKGYSVGSRALIWTSSHSGSRAAALLDFHRRDTSD